MKGKFPRLLCFLIAATAATGCSDSSTPVTPGKQGVGSAASEATQVSVLKRSTPLSRDISASASIGKQGGVIEIREAGIRFIVPGNALTPPARGNTVTITVTALKGDEVAYTFQPHGLQFRSPVRIEQDIRGTSAERDRGILSSVEGAYFPSVASLDAARGTAEVLEFRPTSVDVTGNRIKFTVDHFSGYLIASGRRPNN